MSGRTYNVAFKNVSVSAVQDLIAVTATANMAFEVVSFTIGQTDNPTTPALLAISLKHLPATVTAGSGGNSATPDKDLPTDAAATVTGRINDTTQATTGGTADYPHVDVWNTVNGYGWIFPKDGRPSCKPSEAMVLSLDTAPGGAIHVSGSMKIRELF